MFPWQYSIDKTDRLYGVYFDTLSGWCVASTTDRVTGPSMETVLGTSIPTLYRLVGVGIGSVETSFILVLLEYNTWIPLHSTPPHSTPLFLLFMVHVLLVVGKQPTIAFDAILHS
jgi:hypothetical protein